MTPKALEKLDEELTRFLSEMTEGMGRPERRAAMGCYVTGLLLDGERKSCQPMAARLVDDPVAAGAMRQRLNDCVSLSPWSDAELLRRLTLKLDRELPGVRAFVVDDTGFAKKGRLSVGVARQYSGTLGRTDNCQVATSLHLAGEQGSGCIGFRVYLPKEWTDDRQRCAEAGVPEEIEFKKKWEISLWQIDQALQWGLKKRPVLGDSGYGEIPEYRQGLTDRGLPYVLGVPGNHLIWPPGTKPHPPPRTGKRGRPSKRWRDGQRKPVQISKIVEGIARDDYKTVRWRRGSRGTMSSKFLAFRVRPAEGHTKGRLPAKEQWLLCEWPEGDKQPQFHFSTLPKNFSLRQLVRIAKLRWRVERDYQDMKGEIGLDHFEGRSWRGFHHHATLCAVAHAFLALRRALFPPEQTEVDPALGSSTPATSPTASNRLVSALLSARRRPLPSSRPFPHLTSLGAQP